jgi:hypothetical protein
MQLAPAAVVCVGELAQAPSRARAISKQDFNINGLQEDPLNIIIIQQLLTRPPTNRPSGCTPGWPLDPGEHVDDDGLARAAALMLPNAVPQRKPARPHLKVVISSKAFYAEA